MIEEMLKRRHAQFVRGTCARHGEFTTLKLPGADCVCPECVLSDVRERDRIEVQKRRANSGLQVYWNAGVKQHEPPPLFKDASFDTFISQSPQQEAVRNAIERYSETFAIGGRSLFLSGKTGTGKTHLAISAMKRISERGFRTAYLTIFDLLARSRAYRRDEDISLTTELNSYEYLVIDEIGAHGDFGFNPELVVSTLFQVIDARTMNCLPTTIITNLNGDDLATSANGLGTRAVDRLSKAFSVFFTWESARKNKPIPQDYQAPEEGGEA